MIFLEYLKSIYFICFDNFCRKDAELLACDNSFQAPCLSTMSMKTGCHTSPTVFFGQASFNTLAGTLLYIPVHSIIHHASYDIAADFLLEKLGWRKLDTQRKLEKAVMVYKSLNGLAPDYLRHMFIDRSSITNYSLRDTEGKL